MPIVRIMKFHGLIGRKMMTKWLILSPVFQRFAERPWRILGQHADNARRQGKVSLRLGKTKAGRPKHPLYLRADLKPELFWAPEKS